MIQPGTLLRYVLSLSRAARASPEAFLLRAASDVSVRIWHLPVAARATPVLTSNVATLTLPPSPPLQPSHEPQQQRQQEEEEDEDEQEEEQVARQEAEDEAPPRHVTLRLAHQAPPGCSIGVVGGAPELGSWDAELALPLVQGPGQGMWRADLFLPPSCTRLEYKYVLLGGGQGPGPLKVEAWSPDPNRSLDLASLSKSGASVTVTERWTQGSREVRVVLQAAQPPSPGAPLLTAAQANRQQQQLHLVTGRLGGSGTGLRASGARLARYDELRADMQQLIAQGPRPPFVMEIQLQVGGGGRGAAGAPGCVPAAEDEVASMAGWDPRQQGVDSQELQAMQLKLTQFDLMESGLRDLICLLSARGGCPVAYPVGKAIAAAAAARPQGQRPWSWN
ncbi:hypothetical protein QJQ45_018927 [Haematococcus lacustris]|nr:hypothetical protein QJQ45_018927 [Haematococcus lacustris]